MTTQMCFDAGTRARRGCARSAGAGIKLPVLIGMPGVVDRKRLLEVSMRIGVGPSLSYVRKQRGILQLLRRSTSYARQAVRRARPVPAPSRELIIDGFHYFTLNQLIETWNWEHEKCGRARLVVGS